MRQDDDACRPNPTGPSASATMVVRRLPETLWVLVAVFGGPRVVCNVEQLSKPIREALLAASTGNQLLQRFWHAQCQQLRWAPDDGAPLAPLATVGVEERKRRLLTHTLSKSEGKKSWKQEYAAEYEGYLRRNLRGVGVRHQDVVRRVTTVQLLNTPLPALGASEDESSVGAQVPVVDDAFAQMCMDAGVHAEHFSARHGTTAYTDASHQRPMKTEPTPSDRGAYRGNKALGKHKGKHAKGRAAIWAAWVQGDDVDDGQ